MYENASPAIGGYFGLELSMGHALHGNAVAVNSGRNALRYLLSARPPTKIYIPQFTCNAIAEVIVRLGITFSRYNIDEAMEPVFDFATLRDDEFFLYTNYFGIKNRYIQRLAGRSCQFIIDNAQSFFSPQVEAFDTFYSPRKFFGVSDGGYALGAHATELDPDYSSARSGHLLIRHDDSAQAGYRTYLGNEELMADLPLKAMSALSVRILRSIDYASVASRRRTNFQQLHSALSSSNKLPIDSDSERVALTYPYLSNKANLRMRLQSQNIFTATYWPDVAHSANSSSLERLYSAEIVHLPMDQRYGKEDMDRIIEVVQP